MRSEAILPGEFRIRWLSDLPNSWRIVPSTWLFDLSTERARPDDEQLTASQDDGVILQSDFMRRAGRRVVQVILNREILKHVEPDDFVISMRSFQGGLERSWARGCISSAYVILKPGPQVHVPFFAHVFKSTAYIQALQATSNLVRDGQALRFNNFSMVHLPLAPLAEQHAIADFLDRKTATIDALIEKKERLIALLAEKRAALIHQAVTKGLDPSVPMKDSGVPWIGEIPAHWEMKRLKFLADVRGGVTKGRNLDGRKVESLPYLRVANVQDGYVDLSFVADIDILPSEVEKYSLRQGDILMNEGGDNDKLGRGCVWEGQINPCLHQNHVFAVRPHTSTNPYWISLCTSSAYLRFFFIGRANQTTNLASISSSNLKEAPILWPPLKEQKRILLLLKGRLGNNDALSNSLGESVNRLREYRQALITAAVTGQLNIGDAPEPLAEAEEPPSEPTSPQVSLFGGDR